MVLATHGRGIWTLKIPEIIASPVVNNTGLLITGQLLIQSNLLSQYDSLHVSINDKVVKSIGQLETGELDLTIDLQNEGPKKIQLIGFSEGESFMSNTQTIEFFKVRDLVNTYYNEFAIDTGEFFGNGFSVEVNDGFESPAIHTEHPYPDLSDLTYQLKRPILIASENATFRYQDVAIIESGLPGTAFGEQDFFDFVVVEGSKQGIDWIPIAPSYDASKDADWIEIYGVEGNGIKEVFFEHNVDLLQTFDPGDTVFFRFRLFSDHFTNGWGWAIDNLAIQSDVILGFKEDLLANRLALQVFPNPVRQRANIQFNLPGTTAVQITIYDQLSTVVEQLDLGIRSPGEHLWQWERSSQKDGLYYIRLQTAMGTETFKMILY